MKSTLQTIKDTTYQIPDQEAIYSIAKSAGFNFLADGERALGFANDVSLILELNINTPSNVNGLYLDSGNGKHHKIEDYMFVPKRPMSFLINPDIKESDFEGSKKLLLSVKTNSLYDDIRAIIDGKELKLTDLDRV